MKKNSMYYLKSEVKNLILRSEGKYGDPKQRPVVSLLELKEHPGIYWAIPVGDLKHRNEKQANRIFEYINRDSSNISSCYYHIGKTNKTSVFCISKVIPITDKYIKRPYFVGSNPYTIKNKHLLKELESKLRRILFYEKNNPNSFEQNITNTKNVLIKEMVEEKLANSETSANLDDIAATNS